LLSFRKDIDAVLVAEGTEAQGDLDVLASVWDSARNTASAGLGDLPSVASVPTAASSAHDFAALRRLQRWRLAGTLSSDR
jgi:hypothetical protein